MKNSPWMPLSMMSAFAVALVAVVLSSPAIAESEAGPPPGPPQEGPRHPDGPRPQHGPGPHHPPHDPLRRVLDADGDHVISAEEIINAPSALRSLDKNGDGKLDREELRPMPPMAPGMHRRPGPPDGRRGPPPEGSEARDDFRGPPGPEGPKPEMFVDRLMEFDADSDGKLDRSELMVAAETMVTKRREFMEKMGRWMGDGRRPAPPTP